MNKIIITLLILLLYSYGFCQVNITSGTTLTTQGNVQVVISNLDLLENGTFFTNGSTFHFTGTTNNTISGNPNISFDNFTINKTGTRQVFLSTDIIVNNQLNFLAGLIELNNHNINLISTGNLIGESEASRIKGSTGGFVIRSQFLNAPNAADPGNLGALITSSANLGNVQVKRGHTSQNATDAGGKSINRIYQFNVANNSGLDATLKLKYFNAELNGIDENNLSMYSTDFGITYYNINFNSRDANANFVTQNNFNAFGSYTLSAPSNALPVTLINFAAQCKTDFIQLSWKTQSEHNSDKFDVQRSTNGNTWDKIGSIKSAGNSNSILSYQYNDNTLNNASAFYRLAQYDVDGKVTYSPITKAGCGQSTEFKVMPNPVISIARVVIGADKNNDGMLRLYNASGQQVMQKQIKLSPGTNQYELNISALASGNYNLIFTQTGATNQTVKIIKQ